ncbi:MAG: hypothetical protein AAB268_02075 [Elusimicrobiota bacterium]
MKTLSAVAILSATFCVGPCASSMAQEPLSAQDQSQQAINELIENVRELKFKGPVDYQALPAEEFYTVLQSMGIPLEEAQSIMGIYNWTTKKLYSNADIDPLRSRGTHIHETFHALQDQLFDLEKMTWRAKTTDAQYAVTALTEGDATLTFIECMPESSARKMLGIKRPWEWSGKQPKYDNSPTGAAAQVSRAFDYGIAAKFIQTVKERQGWNGVNALYLKPPLSTAQLLHPEKYFNSDAPKDIDLPDISGSLPQGWELAETDTRGEFVTYLLFLGYPATGPEAESLAAGWTGDLIRTYKNGKTSFSVWKSSWETPEDAQEFREGLIKILPPWDVTYDPGDNSVLALIGVPGSLYQSVRNLSSGLPIPAQPAH